MSFGKIILKSTTKMSLNDRFTALRREKPADSSGGAAFRVENRRQQVAASRRNQRLAAQMENRPAVMAALKLKKNAQQRLQTQQPITIKQRLGVTKRIKVPAAGSQRGAAAMRRGLRGARGPKTGIIRGMARGRGSFRVRGTVIMGGTRGVRRALRGGSRSLSGGRGATMRRGSFQTSRGSFQTSRGSFQTSRGSFQTSRGSFQTSRGSFQASRGSFQASRGNFQASRGSFQTSRGTSSRRGLRGQRAARGRGMIRGRGNVSMNQRGRLAARGSRGFGRRGRSRGRGRGFNYPRPTAEQLDQQLEEYMSKSRSALNSELDTYMQESTD